MSAPLWGGTALPVLGLVSGLPPRTREVKPLLMLQAHVDECGTGQDVLVLAGYVASPQKWAAFSHEWDQVLGMKPRWNYLKMSERATDVSEETRHKLLTLYRVIEKYVQCSICCAVHTDALKSLVDEMHLPRILANPYWIGFRTIIQATAFMAASRPEFGIADEIDFIFDERSEKEKIMAVWDGFKVTLPEELARFVGAPPTFRFDKKVLPLQAADLYAW